MGATAFIGFGEAGAAFAVAGARGYDIKLDHATTRAGKRADFDRAGVRACDTAAEALADADAVLSLVTADQALAAACEDAPHLAPGALWLDMNSVAPETKRGAAAAIEPDGRYVDVAVMSPVNPARHKVPLLVSGAHAGAGAEALAALGFSDIRIVGAHIGDASAIKMIRSVMVKGIEALSAECVLAAEAAGVREDVIASLDASWPGADWATRFDYNLERMMIHGKRRAAEMEEAVKTLDTLGTGSAMSRGTIERQLAIGALGIAPPVGLGAKISCITPLLSVTPAKAGVSRLSSAPTPHETPAFAGVTDMVGVTE